MKKAKADNLLIIELLKASIENEKQIKGRKR